MVMLPEQIVFVRFVLALQIYIDSGFAKDTL